MKTFNLRKRIQKSSFKLKRLRISRIILRKCWTSKRLASLSLRTLLIRRPSRGTSTSCPKRGSRNTFNSKTTSNLKIPSKILSLTPPLILQPKHPKTKKTIPQKILPRLNQSPVTTPPLTLNQMIPLTRSKTRLKKSQVLLKTPQRPTLSLLLNLSLN